MWSRDQDDLSRTRIIGCNLSVLSIFCDRGVALFFALLVQEFPGHAAFRR